MIRNIWFDIDDTLVDFRRNSLTALHVTYRQFGLESLFGSAQAWVDCYHKHNADVWRDYEAGVIDERTLRTRRFIRPLVEAGMPEIIARQKAPEMDQAYLDTLAREPHTIGGAAPTLKALKNMGYTIGALSNGFDGIQQLKLTACGLDGYIDHVVVSEAVGAAKPARGIFEAAMQMAGSTDPAENLMVGDNPATDIAGALAAGWRAAYLSADSDKPTPAAAVRISCLAEIRDVVSRENTGYVK